MDWSPQVDAEETGEREHWQLCLVLIVGEAVYSVKCYSTTDLVLIKDALY